MQGQIKMDQIMECKHAADWDGMNVKDFLKKYLWTQGGFGVVKSTIKEFFICYLISFILVVRSMTLSKAILITMLSKNLTESKQ